MIETTTKTPYIKQAADWARRHGYTDIKANTEGYSAPSGYGRQHDGQAFIPDVTGQQFDQRTYFEVILKTMDQDYLVSKLTLLAQLAALHGGQLYLLSPKGHLPFTKSLVATNRISATVINLL